VISPKPMLVSVIELKYTMSIKMDARFELSTPLNDCGFLYRKYCKRKVLISMSNRYPQAEAKIISILM
jgi:hypothetical protein